MRNTETPSVDPAQVREIIDAAAILDEADRFADWHPNERGMLFIQKDRLVELVRKFVAPALARAEEAERESARLSEINGVHCRDFNTLLVREARVSDQLAAAEQERARLAALLEWALDAIDDLNDGPITDSGSGVGWSATAVSFYREARAALSRSGEPQTRSET